MKHSIFLESFKGQKFLGLPWWSVVSTQGFHCRRAQVQFLIGEPRSPQASRCGPEEKLKKKKKAEILNFYEVQIIILY